MPIKQRSARVVVGSDTCKTASMARRPTSQTKAGRTATRCGAVHGEHTRLGASTERPGAGDAEEAGVCGCDNPPRRIPYYHLNQSTLVIKQ
jgi:hypothetical protein